MPDATLRAGEAGPCRAPVRFRLRVSAEQAADEFLLVKRGAPPRPPAPTPAGQHLGFGSKFEVHPKPF